MIICDTCKKDVTPGKHQYDICDDGEEWVEYRMVRLDYGTRMCFCNDCLHTLMEFAGSEEHLQKALQYRREQMELESVGGDYDEDEELNDGEVRLIEDETSVKEVLPGDEGYEDAPTDIKTSDRNFLSNLLSRPNRSRRGGRGLQ